MSAKRMLKLGLSIRGVGYHIAAWRHPSIRPEIEQTLAHYVEVAQIAEKGLFDTIFFADGVAIRESGDMTTLAGYSTLARLEPMTLLPALAMVTRNIGLAATASTTYNAPYHIARKFATLDIISGGRGAWNAVTSWTDAEAANFGLVEQIPPDERYDRATEFIAVVLGLWESFAPDAFLFDQAGGCFQDPAKIRTLNHQGRYFAVRGPLNVPPSPQGRPVIFQAGASEKGRDMAAAYADAVFSAAQSLDEAQAFYAAVKGRLGSYGRKPDELLVMPGISVIVGRTEAEAREKHRSLQDLISPEIGKALLASFFGDLSNVGADEPLPAFDPEGKHSFARRLGAIAADGRMTVRQLYEAMAGGRGHLSLVGSAEAVADTLALWFENGAADGFNLAAPLLPGSLADFVDLVVPILQERGLFRTAYEGSTLRENLALPRPSHDDYRRQRSFQ